MVYYVVLSEEQQDKAESLLIDVKSGSVSSPQDIVSWKAPEKDITIGDSFETETVDSTEVVGPYSPSNRTRFEPDRVEMIIEKILNEDWSFEPDSFPPCLVEVDNQYYVFRDGIHRSIIHKYLGLSMFSEVHETG